MDAFPRLDERGPGRGHDRPADHLDMRCALRVHHAGVACESDSIETRRRRTLRPQRPCLALSRGTRRGNVEFCYCHSAVPMLACLGVIRLSIVRATTKSGNWPMLTLRP